MTTFKTECCIAGGGPAGLMAGYLLARAGVQVIVLEKHGDFLRDFRGDTVHPSTLDIMDELGLLDRFLKLPHQKVEKLTGLVGDTPVAIADFTHLPVRAKYIALMPQWDFLNFLAEEGKRYPGFDVLMKTEATDVIEADGSVVGVRARGDDGTSRDILADVVIAADGRGSVLRDRAGLTVEDLGAPMDALWFKVPAHPDDSDQTMGRFGAGYILVQLFRGDYWQCAYVIPKGALGNIQAKGIEAFRDLIFEAGPFDRERLKAIRSWDDVKLLTVRVDRLKTWYRPGFLAIGDAAHAMSPIGGVGVNLAVQDAVAAANQLARPLREGTVSVSDLEAVQTRRMFPTRVIQAIQVAAQNNIIGPTLRLKEKPTPPFALRLMQRFPVLRRIPARVLGLGVRREHVAEFIRDAKG
ncbi:FAD-dependent oxidoreductase [Hyphomicrobium sp. DMF-1]|jgi:2-polyprenyl-6-methoxyphenol hydroxylase-like FAD-dependent oxidoreductase|uniref:FAD-dependent oxidoreductase n=1 Tax=Hyphomicrobium sp. DMF-1 TaxID=3019544 RepID=UPI0022EBB466|nr:FAD-dependent oxidoreductase [Hyphomicrobium sp. DMF-1]WBT36404.1 FAD-dependent oxidoreductase [Hyphomicrobium sp. DMF-1]